MAIATFNEDAITAVRELEEQNWHLLGLLEKTYQDFLAKKSKENLGFVLSELSAYATHHFHLAERWMKETNYEGLEEHKVEHDDFCRRIMEIQRDFIGGNRTLTLELLSLMKSWYSEHVLKADEEYWTFVASTALQSNFGIAFAEVPPSSLPNLQFEEHGFVTSRR
jgi:hemerythrin